MSNEHSMSSVDVSGPPDECLPYPAFPYCPPPPPPTGGEDEPGYGELVDYRPQPFETEISGGAAHLALESTNAKLG